MGIRFYIGYDVFHVRPSITIWERKSLAGVGAQYDSELVYHNVREEVAAQGVVYTDMESALNGEYADMVRKHFMKLVTPRDHKFAALHGAVWSGGSFVYVPPGVSVTIPLQSYFRLNAPGAGQFEHTLIIVDEGAYLHFIEGCSAPKYNVANLHAGCVELFVGKNAKLRYSTIENWSKNMYWKRRLAPWKASRPLMMASVLIPMVQARAMAAMAFPALCRPGTASLISQMASLLCMAVSHPVLRKAENHFSSTSSEFGG